MKVGTIITATDLNPLYVDFIPYFIKSWKTLFPGSDVIIILIADEIPERFKKYAENIKLFKPIDGIKTAFIAQNIRLLYPRQITRDGGVIISDMDMIPLNRKYYEAPIKNISDDTFISYRDVLLPSELPMCYNIALPETWSKIFGTRPIEEQLKEWYSGIYYDGNHGGSGWNTDQLILVKKYNEYTGPKVVLNDRVCQFKRLDRSYQFCLTKEIYEDIVKGRYSDYHCMRPYLQFKQINDVVLEGVCQGVKNRLI